VFEFVRYVARNPAEVTRGVRRLWRVRRAMAAFRGRPENSECAWCGRSRRLEVHHIIPVSVAPDLADDQGNMLMLCRKPACHQVIGHNGDFKSRYVENVLDVCADSERQVVRTIPAG
jgi:hypothetical protein